MPRKSAAANLPHTNGLDKRCDALPWNLPKRGLSREEAAEWWGVSPTLFDRGVEDGLIPDSYKFYGRRLWDLRKLERAFDALDTSESADNPWARMEL